MEYDPDKEVFVVEGLLDALSLICMGYQAIAILGAGFKPDSFDLSEFRNLVFAFDNDHAGRQATRQWMDHFKDRSGIKVSAILPLPGRGDFNDFLCNSQDHQAAQELFEKNRAKFETQGRLALADSAFDYAKIKWDSTGYAPGLFAFRGCYHDSWIKNQGDPEKEEITVSQVSNFTVDVVLATRSDENEDRPVFQYQLKVKPQKGHFITVLADGNDIKSPDAMKGFFLRHGRAHWYGTGHAVDGFIKMVVESRCPVVRAVQCAGYDHKTDFFLLKDIAFDLAGRPIKPEKGLFKTGIDYIQPAKLPTIKPVPAKQVDFKRIYGLIRQAWSDNGCIALSFLCASLFVNQIKSENRFFPFLSLFGDPQTGKSRLVNILNNMQGLDEEGLPMSSANTKKGELRKLSEISGMMKALIEGNDPGKSRFDFESILPLYNYGNPLQTRALKTNDNRTKDLSFYGSLAFVQNMEPFKSRAAKERVISLKFSKSDLNDETKAGFDELSRISNREYASFLELIFRHRQDIEKNWFSEYRVCKSDLSKKIPDNRINENHAIVLCFHRLLCRHLDIDHDLQPAIKAVGAAKTIACQKRTQTPADHFFDCLDQLPDRIKDFGATSNFYMIKDRKLYVNRPKAEEAIRMAGITLDYPERLGKSLQEHPAYIENKNVKFTDDDDKSRARKAWIFDIEKIREG